MAATPELREAICGFAGERFVSAVAGVLRAGSGSVRAFAWSGLPIRKYGRVGGERLVSSVADVDYEFDFSDADEGVRGD